MGVIGEVKNGQMLPEVAPPARKAGGGN